MIPPSPAASSLATASAVAPWAGTWSRPPDLPAQAALALAVMLLVLTLFPRGPQWLASLVDLANAGDPGRRRRFLTVASFFAAFLSLGYVAFYLRGGPRAPEASAYWVQGRAMSHGALAWAVSEPSAEFRARYLLFAAPDRLSGVFPPGYPLLLAMGFLVGAPMLVGPLLAAAIALVTWWLAHEVLARGADAQDTPTGDNGARAETIARLATGLSIVSAALRYHTADALPEGAAALAVASSLACALRARRTGQRPLFAAAGLAVGFLVAAHPASAPAVAILVAAIAATSGDATRGPRRVVGLAWTSLAWICAGALPGLLFLFAANHAATGHALAWPAAAYAALAPAGVASVASVAPLAAAPSAPLTLLRCVRGHLLDIANLEPIALLAVLPLLGGRARRGATLLGLVVGGQVLAQALSLRGLGSGVSLTDPRVSLLVAVLPLEHVLVALGVDRLFSRGLARASVMAIALALAGFAVHAAHEHEAIAAGGLGRPHFEPDVLREASIAHGLVFFDDDHGFELAHDPGVVASHGIEAARLRGDDHDRLLYDLLGHPQVHRYIATAASASVVSWAPINGGSETWRFETEADWPPVAQSGGWADVIVPGNGCASEGHVVRISPAGMSEASVTLALPVPSAPGPSEKHAWIVTPRILQHGDGGTGALAVVAEPGLPPLAEWSWDDAARPTTCLELPSRTVELGGKYPRAWLVVRAHGGPVMVDRTTIRAR